MPPGHRRAPFPSGGSGLHSASAQLPRPWGSALISLFPLSLYRGMRASLAGRLSWTPTVAGGHTVVGPSQGRTTPRWTARQLTLLVGWPSPW